MTHNSIQILYQDFPMKMLFMLEYNKFTNISR